MALLTSVLATEKIKVVATFLPIYAHTQSIAGHLADVHCLVGAGTDPHDFQFKPSDMKKLSEAEVIVMNGVGIEMWLDKPLEKFRSMNKTVINASEGLSLLENTEIIELSSAHEGHHHNEGDHCDQHGEGKNPHTWLDPVNASLQVKNILNGLIKADPKNKNGYEKNASLYLAELEKLHQEFKSEVEVLKNKNLITFHDAFLYLAHRYQFKYIGCVEDVPEKKPSPKVLKEIIDLIKNHQVKTVFVEEGYSQRSLHSISRDSGAKIATLDTIEVGKPEANAYLNRMRNNIQALKSAWQ